VVAVWWWQCGGGSGFVLFVCLFLLQNKSSL